MQLSSLNTSNNNASFTDLVTQSQLVILQLLKERETAKKAQLEQAMFQGEQVKTQQYNQQAKKSVNTHFQIAKNSYRLPRSTTHKSTHKPIIPDQVNSENNQRSSVRKK